MRLAPCKPKPTPALQQKPRRLFGFGVVCLAKSTWVAQPLPRSSTSVILVCGSASARGGELCSSRIYLSWGWLPSDACKCPGVPVQHVSKALLASRVQGVGVKGKASLCCLLFLRSACWSSPSCSDPSGYLSGHRPVSHLRWNVVPGPCHWQGSTTPFCDGSAKH